MHCGAPYMVRGRQGSCSCASQTSSGSSARTRSWPSVRGSSSSPKPSVASRQYVTGDYAAAVETANRVVALADQLSLPEPGNALGVRGFARYMGDLAGLTDAERAFELQLAAGLGRNAAVNRHNLACTRWFLEGPAAAVATLEDARAFSEGRGLTEMVQVHVASSVVFLIDNGRFDEALARAEWILPRLRESGDRLFEHDVLAGQAVALDERGQNALVPAERAIRPTSPSPPGEPHRPCSQRAGPPR